MVKFNVVRDKLGAISRIETPLSGADLLSTPKLNKGCAFTLEERQLFNLEGLLPLRIETLDEQVVRMYEQFLEHPRKLSKNIYLNALYDYNETLFYRLVNQHLEEMLPIIYTPTVGEAVERFSLELRKTRGLYLNFTDLNKMDRLLETGIPKDTDLIVVSDGEAVLGIGDQGIGGIKICQAKAMVYTLCGGLDPHRLFPIQLDVGTNNSSLLEDPMYLGWRHERMGGQAYDDFVDHFITSIKRKLPNVYVHWEDVGRDNARRILNRYREQLCTFNGDIQGTGAVALASILAASIANNIPLNDQRIIIFGAGTAGVGIADQIVSAMVHLGLSEKEAHHRFWLIDKQGLLIEDQDALLPFQKVYARARKENEGIVSLRDVVQHIKPTILIGASTQGGAFTEEIVKMMASFVKNPVILPLSNPTSKSEAKPADLLEWTEGRAIIATGSPFNDVEFKDRKIRIAQSNNALAFPGIGLGAIAAKARFVTDEMLWVAAKKLSERCPVNEDKSAPLLPKLSESIQISREIALAVAQQARIEGVSNLPADQNLEEAINLITWEPKYYPYHRT